MVAKNDQFHTISAYPWSVDALISIATDQQLQKLIILDSQ